MANPIPATVVETLVDHHRRFLDFLQRRVGSREAAEEVLQAAFVKGLERGGELREMEGASVAEAAARLGITPGNAAVRVHRARQALKQRLEAACGTCTEHGCLDCSCEASRPN